MAGFGALAHLDFDHAHLGVLRLHGEALRVETAVAGAATEVAAAQFPGQVAAVFAVVRADTAFAGVMGEVTQLGALVQRADCVGAQRAKAHRRDIEYRRRIRLCALRAADHHTERAGVAQGSRAHGVTDKFEAGLVHVDQGAEGFVGSLVLGPRVHQRTLGAGEGQGVAVGLQQVLADFRADGLHQVTDIAQDRVVAAHRVRALQQVEQADQAQHAGDQRDRPHPLIVKERQAGKGEQDAHGKEGVTA